MLPIHTILHGTDFSDRSNHALHMAAALARDYGARLIVLHVATAPPMVYSDGIIPPVDLDRQVEQAREELARLPLPSGAVRRFEEGDTEEVILRVASEERADLLVLGTHGRTGLGRLLMGSVAERILRRAQCPVLTVKMPFPEAVEERESRLSADLQSATI